MAPFFALGGGGAGSVGPNRGFEAGDAKKRSSQQAEKVTSSSSSGTAPGSGKFGGGASRMRKPVRNIAVTLAAATGASGVAFVALAHDKPNKRNPVAFFDLDHTILDCNSNKHWIQHEVQNGKVKPKMIITAIYWFTRYAMGFGAGAESAGAEAAMLYAGTKESDLKSEVEELFDRELAHRMRPGCKAVMDMHVANGQRCIVCTSSWWGNESDGCPTGRWMTRVVVVVVMVCGAVPMFGYGGRRGGRERGDGLEGGGARVWV